MTTATSPVTPGLMSSLAALCDVAFLPDRLQDELRHRQRDPLIPFLVLPNLGMPVSVAHVATSTTATSATSSPVLAAPSPVVSLYSVLPGHFFVPHIVQSSTSSSAPHFPVFAGMPYLLHQQQQHIALARSSSPSGSDSGSEDGAYSPYSSRKRVKRLHSPSHTSARRQPSLSKQVEQQQQQQQAEAGEFSHNPHKRAYKHSPPPTANKQCTSCGTSTTPEWRSGPTGPKTLCNACGLQYSKAQKQKQ